MSEDRLQVLVHAGKVVIPVPAGMTALTLPPDQAHRLAKAIEQAATVCDGVEAAAKTKQ